MDKKYYAGQDIINAIIGLMETVGSIKGADVVEVVRCKDCEHSYDSIGGWICSHGVCVDCVVPEGFFCKYGKRKEGEE